MSEKTRSKRLQPIVRLAQHGEKQAAGRLGSVRRELEAAESQLNRLLQYKKEYLKSLEHQRGTACPAGMLRYHREFISKIDGAIDEQSGKVSALQFQLKEATEHWQTKRARRTAIDKAQEKMRHEERQAKGRLEQKQTDEDNSLKASRNSSSLLAGLRSQLAINRLEPED